VTQVPFAGDSFEKITGNFANHLPGTQAAPRGGDLWITYPNASAPPTLRNLTAEAGFGDTIAARDPSVHWDGTKALVSLVVGTSANARWQVYEVSGLGRSEKVVFKRLNQPDAFNHIGAIHDSRDRIVMVSDMPRPGPGAEHRHLYPQLDEYEEKATPSGLWRLEPGTGAQGAVTLLHHAPSGAFRPFIDSYGRVVFTNWDHLQRDQQSGDAQQGLFNWPDESNGPRDPGPDTGAATRVAEVFPERFGKAYRDGVHDHVFNFFLPWMINQDGSGAETLNHIGRHELGLFGFASKGGGSGPAFGLSDTVGARGVNADLVDRGLKLDAFHYLREAPNQRGTYFAVRAQEFGTHGGGCITKILGDPARRPQDMKVSIVTPESTCNGGGPALHRSPLPTSDGRLLSSVSTVTYVSNAGSTQPYNYRLNFLKAQGAAFVPDATGALTPGLSKVLNGKTVTLWEWDAAEVLARARPVDTTMEPLEAPEASVFAAKGVALSEFRQFLTDNRLALIVSRNVTRRDAFDRAQPFNLKVRRAGGVQSIGSNAQVFDVDHLQLFEAEQLRGVRNDPSGGRRVLAQPMKPVVVGGKAGNPAADANAPAGSVKVAADGSMAALVPADRATTWQLVDSTNPGDPKKGNDGVVLERFWLSFRPGEVRVCASCHGVSEKDQTGAAFDQVKNPPAALAELLDHYLSQLRPATVARSGTRAAR
jgi:Hydrazine synthase alpha subunit middle domain